MIAVKGEAEVAQRRMVAVWLPRLVAVGYCVPQHGQPHRVRSQGDVKEHGVGAGGGVRHLIHLAAAGSCVLQQQPPS